MIQSPLTEEDEALIGRHYRKGGYEYQLYGIMLHPEDWYWVMTHPSGKITEHTELYPISLSLEHYGFEIIEPEFK